jgi:hypothetical protein
VNPVTQVQVSVEGTEPDIRVSGSSDFGVVSAWSSQERDFEVCNVGRCPLEVSAATLGCTDFALSGNPFPATLGPGSCVDLTVAFTPATPGPKSCQLDVASDDPDSPVVSRTLTARTPPWFSLHAGLVDPTGGMGSTHSSGASFNLDYLQPVSSHFAWDVRFGVSILDGKAGADDVDIWNLSANARHTFNPAASLQLFLNGGLGIYQLDPGDTEGGGNLGLGLAIPAGRRYVVELTYNYHSVFTASPSVEFHQVQAGFRVAF